MTDILLYLTPAESSTLLRIAEVTICFVIIMKLCDTSKFDR